jgi:hypothetical protein
VSTDPEVFVLYPPLSPRSLLSSLRFLVTCTPVRVCSSAIFGQYIDDTVFIIIILSGVRLSPHGTAATVGLLYRPQAIGDIDCGAIIGMENVRGNRSIRRKPAPVLPLCPSQIPHDLTRNRDDYTNPQS